MNVKKRFRTFISELQREKEKALNALDKEYQLKRQKIEEEYDLNSLLKSVEVEACNLCEDEFKWKCNRCNYCLCEKCIEKIYKSRKQLSMKMQSALILSSLPLREAKRKFIEEGLVCPQCKSSKIRECNSLE